MGVREIYQSYGLLPYNQLPDITDPAWNPPPLVVEREGENGQYLLDLGLAHRSDSGNPHHHTLQAYGETFAYCTQRGLRIMFIEGGPWKITSDANWSYGISGEPMWASAYAAKIGGTMLVRAELPRDGADLLLEEGFTRDEIACYYFVRQVPQWERMKIRPDFKQYIQDKIDLRAEMLGWNFDFSFKHLVEIYEGTYDKRFDRTETRFFLQQSVGYMLEPTSRIQEVATICNMGRDINLIELQLEFFNRGFSIWTTYGWSHIRALLPRLEKVGVRGETTYIAPEQHLGSLTLRNYVLH